MASNLGALLFRKTLPKAGAVIVLIFAIALVGLCFAGGKFDLSTLGLGAFGVGLAAMAVWLFSYSAEVHENGAVTRHLFGRREIRFDQLKSFAYAQVSVNGQPQNTLTFIAHAGKPVRIVTQPSRGGDQDLTSLVDHLAERFGRKMRADLDRRGRVAWIPKGNGLLAGPALAISRDSLIISDGKGDKNLLFGEIEAQIANGYFMLKERQSGKTVLQRECGAENFYPGLRLFNSLQAPRASAS